MRDSLITANGTAGNHGANGKQAVPRALPFQAPQTDQAAFRHLRRWTLMMGGAAALLIVSTVAAFVFWHNQLNAGEGKMEPALEAKAVPANAAPASSVPANVTPAKVDTAPPVVAAAKVPVAPLGDDPKKQPPVSEAASAKQNERLLEAVGGLSAAHLYQSYLNIGLIADGVESEAYSKGEGTKLLQTVQDLLTQVDNNLQRVGQTGLPSDDLQSLDRIRQVSGMLRSQGTALLGYWATGGMEQISAYHAARELSWAELRELMGVED